MIYLDVHELRRDATAALNFRGHVEPKLDDWEQIHESHRGYSAHMRLRYICPRCGYGVWIDNRPPPNGIDIGGKAVALECSV